MKMLLTLPPYMTNNVIFNIIKFELMPCFWQNSPNFEYSGFSKSVCISVDISFSLSFSSPILNYTFGPDFEYKNTLLTLFFNFSHSTLQWTVHFSAWIGQKGIDSLLFFCSTETGIIADVDDDDDACRLCTTPFSVSFFSYSSSYYY